MHSSSANEQGSYLRIAFDAKRVYQNNTGLGHYSRSLIASLATFYPQHQYYLCAPKLTNRFDKSGYANIRDVVPQSFAAKKLPSAWRSNWVKYDLKKLGINIYHGLSHEIPVGIQYTGIKTVVTIHDLIFERYPDQYKWIDVQIYRKKFMYACKNADIIIAISKQTKEDIIRFYNIPDQKIHICYQSCNPIFQQKVSVQDRLKIKELYQLPDQYFLYVGSIIERKNLLNICKAYALLKEKLDIPLVVIGDGNDYKKRVIRYVTEQNLTDAIIFLSDMPYAKSSMGFQQATDFPAIYQMATAIIYPSIFEGFGIPVLEGLWSGTPVITSNISCMPETGGDAAFYVDPYKPEQIAHAMMELTSNTLLVADMVEKGYRHAENFTPAKCAAAVMQVYLRL